MKKGAEFSKCGKYRYKLWRVWNKDLPLVMCIGLNPSTADAEKNDATINILINVLTRLEYGGFYMVNLYAWISSKPSELYGCKDPVKDNGIKIQQVDKICSEVIFCWGNFTHKDDWVISFMIENYPAAKCFGYNKNRTPIHPRGLTYIKNGIQSVKLIPYELF